MHGGSPKGKKLSGGLDVEAEECTEEVQKGRSGVVDWTLKRRNAWRKSKREENEWFKSDAFTREVKEMFTEIINSHVKEESEKLSVFQQGGVYLATKKIGKNNPKEAEIRADNVARQEWNRTVDVALVEGVPEEDILTIKREKITDKTLQSIRTHGWLPDMFQQIIRGAKDFLQEMIFKFKLPPKPVPKIDLQEWNDMRKLMEKLQKIGRASCRERV